MKKHFHIGEQTIEISRFIPKNHPPVPKKKNQPTRRKQV